MGRLGWRLSRGQSGSRQSLCIQRTEGSRPRPNGGAGMTSPAYKADSHDLLTEIRRDDVTRKGWSAAIQIVFIDGSITGHKPSRPASSRSSSTPDRDGVRQIAEHLARRDLHAIAIVSHGASGFMHAPRCCRCGPSGAPNRRADS